MSNFISRWHAFFQKATDASPEYAEASALMALASVATGRRELNVGKGVRPNLFMMLAGDSSVARKSTSVMFCKDAVEQVDPVRIGPRDYTVEGLVRWMSQEKDPKTNKTRNKLTLFAEEFGADLKRAEAYGPTMTADFCALYDGNNFEKVRAKGPAIFIEKPRISLFAACAYQMLRSGLQKGDWESGYMMRFLYVVPNSGGSAPTRFDLQPVFPKTEFSNAVMGLKHLKDIMTVQFRKLSFEPAAEAAFIGFARSLQAYTNTGSSASEMATIYTGRFITNAQKLALLYQIDENPELPVSLANTTKALTFAQQICWPSFQRVLEETTQDDFELVTLGVTTILRQSAAPVKKTDLVLKYRTQTLRQVLDHLKWTGNLFEANTPMGTVLSLRK